jgi:hypothetical protein
MYQTPPTFNGFDPITEPIEVFLRQLLRYFAINDIVKDRWAVILDTLIEEPALTLYNTALTTPFADGGIRDDVGGLADNALALELAARYDARAQWLRNNYNGVNQQEVIKDLLSGMFQGLKEDPRTFYLRVTVQARRAGYIGDVMTTMVKQTFMNGLHKEIFHKIAEQPRLDLAPTVELAVRIWNNSNQRSNQNLTLFPQQAEEERSAFPSLKAPKVILARTTRPTPEEIDEMRQTEVPPQFRHDPRNIRQQKRQQEADFEDTLEEVIQRMKKLEAHILQPSRQEAPQRRIDYRDTRRPLPTQRQEFSQSNKRNNACFRCGEEGHLIRDCQTETSTRASPSNRSQNNQINMIDEYSSDYEEDSDYQRNLVN